MKGSLHTDELMKAVLARPELRTKRRLSHVFRFDVPMYHKPLFITDAALNIAPTLDDKVHIVQNAIDLVRVLGVAQPKVAVLAAVESVNSKMEATLDAAALCKMADRGQITGGIIDGPLAFDNARERRHLRRRVNALGLQPRHRPVARGARLRQLGLLVLGRRVGHQGLDQRVAGVVLQPRHHRLAGGEQLLARAQQAAARRRGHAGTDGLRQGGQQHHFVFAQVRGHACLCGRIGDGQCRPVAGRLNAVTTPRSTARSARTPARGRGAAPRSAAGRT
jgi:hypothetical protein